MKGVPFDVEVCMEAVESYVSGAKKVGEIVRERGISEATFFNKLREYKRNGGRIDSPGRGGKALVRTEEFNRVLTGLKEEHPDYGRGRLTRELARKRYAVSPTTVGKALNELSLQLPPKRGASVKLSSSGDHRPEKKKA